MGTLFLCFALLPLMWLGFIFNEECAKVVALAYKSFLICKLSCHSHFLSSKRTVNENETTSKNLPSWSSWHCVIVDQNDIFKSMVFISHKVLLLNVLLISVLEFYRTLEWKKLWNRRCGNCPTWSFHRLMVSCLSLKMNTWCHFYRFHASWLVFWSLN